MAEQLSRKKLYDLVWFEPMRNLAVRFGISDVALKKTCARAGIPTPDRGYWAKKEAGKETIQAALPLRPPGMEDEVSIASGGSSSYHYWNREEILGFVGAAPQFDEPIETVRARIAETVGHVAVPHTIRTWHPAIGGLLKEDEKRREKQRTDPYPSSWDKPLFDTPFERRRLRVLNSMFLAVAKMNGKAFVQSREARKIRISFFRQHLHLTLDRPKRSNRRAQVLNTTGESSDSKLCLSILSNPGSESALAFWQDEEAQKIEMRMTEVAVQTILTAETQYRENALHQYQWRIKRKAELEEEERKRRIDGKRRPETVLTSSGIGYAA